MGPSRAILFISLRIKIWIPTEILYVTQFSVKIIADKIKLIVYS